MAKDKKFESGFGSGEFEFGAWPTPFENAEIVILEAAFAPVRSWPETIVARYRNQSLLHQPDGDALKIRVYDHASDAFFRISFDAVSAFKVLDEGGLLEFWAKTEEFGGRPGQTTFKVRNHLWTEESFIPFLGTNDGWSFIIASDSECLEILAYDVPVIEQEAEA